MHKLFRLTFSFIIPAAFLAVLVASPMAYADHHKSKEGMAKEEMGKDGKMKEEMAKEEMDDKMMKESKMGDEKKMDDEKMMEDEKMKK